MVFFDDFEGTELDRDHWNVIGPEFWVNNEVQAYVDSAATISVGDGVLELTARWSEGYVTPRGRTTDIVSGRIDSRNRFDFQYGRAEARIRMPGTEGLWPAFWLLGYGGWPGSGEIDIMEYVGEPDWIGVALHGPGYSGETPIVNKFFFPEGEDVTDWHVYAADWTRDEVLFFVDERLVYRATRPMVEHYGEWRFDNPKFLILNTAVGGMYPFKTSGIEEPYFGLPQETVDRIRETGLAMQVDWVRVTRDPVRHAGG
ncbi:MAG: glycoside hydrolase family 16 protein [Bacteroidetes bacterium]|nr:glycoside hydrolase family 16 protein [Bacteroidota bacterium]